MLTGVATVAFWIVLGVIERSLASGTPGIVEFEFVRTADRAPASAPNGEAKAATRCACR